MSIIGHIKAGRVRIYKLNTFKAFTDSENAIYNDKHKKNAELLTEIHNNVNVRSIPDRYLNEYNEIAIFENDIVRLALSDRGIETCDYQSLDEIVYLKVCHNEILWQILRDGIIIGNKEHMLFTATTGQVRNVTVTLMRKDFFEKHKGFLMVGLSIESINANGGKVADIVGKFVAQHNLKSDRSIDDCWETFYKLIVNAEEKPQSIVTRNLKAVKRTVDEGYAHVLKRTCVDQYKKKCFVFYENDRIAEIKNEEDAISRAKYEEKHTSSRKEMADTRMSELIKKTMEVK